MTPGGKALASILIVTAAWAARGALGKASAPSVEDPVRRAEACLACHGKRDATMRFGDGEEVSLFVDSEEYRSSAHTSVGCAACHPDATLPSHPGGPAPPDRAAYADAVARVCQTCHAAGRGEEPPIHRRLLERARRPRCPECHDAHRMRRVREWKPALPLNLYCLTCHQTKLTVSLDGGEAFTLTIREADLGKSVHLRHGCTDCHPGFSKLEHPVRDISNRRAHSLEAAEACRRCHPEQYRREQGSFHEALVRRGHPGAPVCTDCHESHAVAEVASLRTLGGIVCRRCHEEVFEAYRKSRHGLAASRSGHVAAPLCTGCHRAHEVCYRPLGDDLAEACQRCHEDARARHRRWLPKVDTHFEAVTCPACHAPPAGCQLTVRIVDLQSGLELSQASAIREAGEGFGAAAGACDLGFWGDLVCELNQRSGRREDRFRLLLDVANGSGAHALGGREEARRECESCHRGDLRYLERVYVPQR